MEHNSRRPDTLREVRGGPNVLTTGQSAGLAVYGGAKRGKPNLAPKAHPYGGGESPAFMRE